MTESEKGWPRQPSARRAPSRRTSFSHATIDQRNAREDRFIARRLRHDRRLLRQARTNLHRWMARDGKRVRPVFAEWQRILKLTANQIADFLISDTPMARRLRQSTPFMGLFASSRQRRTRRA